MKCIYDFNFSSHFDAVFFFKIINKSFLHDVDRFLQHPCNMVSEINSTETAKKCQLSKFKRLYFSFNFNGGKL
jgi:hypothetical protein